MAEKAPTFNPINNFENCPKKVTLEIELHKFHHTPK